MMCLIHLIQVQYYLIQNVFFFINTQNKFQITWSVRQKNKKKCSIRGEQIILFKRKSEQYKTVLQVANSINLCSNTHNFLVNKKVKKMSWINRIFSKSPSSSTRKANVPEGVWTKCTACEQVLYSEELKRNLYVCPKCGHHMRIDARERLLNLLDEDSSQEIAADLEPKDILKFKDLKKYKDRINAAQKETGEKDALITMTGTLYNMPIVVAASNFAFMGGSMGSVVGAKFVKAAEKSDGNELSVCMFLCEWWCSYAGSIILFNANGKNQCRTCSNA